MNKKIIIALSALLIVCAVGSYFATVKINENRDEKYNHAVYNYYKNLNEGKYDEIESDIITDYNKVVDITPEELKKNPDAYKGMVLREIICYEDQSYTAKIYNGNDSYFVPIKITNAFNDGSIISNGEGIRSEYIKNIPVYVRFEGVEDDTCVFTLIEQEMYQDEE